MAYNKYVYVIELGFFLIVSIKRTCSPCGARSWSLPRNAAFSASFADISGVNGAPNGLPLTKNQMAEPAIGLLSNKKNKIEFAFFHKNHHHHQQHNSKYTYSPGVGSGGLLVNAPGEGGVLVAS